MRGRDADLVRLLEALGPTRGRRQAHLLGFSKARRARSTRGEDDAPLPEEPRTALDEAQSPRAAAATKSAEARFWRLAEYHGYERREEPRKQTGEGLPATIKAHPEHPLRDVPTTPPLEPWASIEPCLAGALAERLRGTRVDVPALVRKLGRGEAIQRIPRVTRRVWPRRLVVWLDRSRRHLPVSDDQLRIVLHLWRELGDAAVEVEFFAAEDLDAAWQRTGDLAAEARLEPGVPVLALTDLGACSRTPSQRALWQRTGLALARRRIPAVALCPVPAGVVPLATRQHWTVVPWGPPSRVVGQDERQARALRLTRFAAMADLVQPGLLRALRQALPRGQADLLTELDALERPEWSCVDGTGATLRADQHDGLRQAFVAGEFLEPERAEAEPELVRTLQARARDLIARWHRGLPRELLSAEVLAWEARELRTLPAPKEDSAWSPAEARAFLHALHKELEDEPHTPDALAWRAYAWRLLRGIPDQGLPDDKDSAVVSKLWSLVHPQDYRGAVPSFVERAHLVEAAQQGPPPATWLLRQVGAELVVEALDAEPDPHRDVPRSGSPVTRIQAAKLWTRRGDERGLVPLEGGERIPLPAEGRLRLETDRATLYLEAWPDAGLAVHDAPDWAVPAWATRAGRDQHGLWADADLDGVLQRFRWIPPGRFEMGSPEDEAGRYDDEHQHTVTLTHGYWLGDTPVTQALWTASGRDNPSRFVDPQRPVEQVSWHDARAFAEALGCRLPTEAEWERACRAGTTTATWRGDLDIRGQNHAPQLSDIAWYGGNSGDGYDLDEAHDSSGWPGKEVQHSRAGTRKVETKAANPWGLYDMLGNVWEWCEDGWRERLEEPLDPCTPPGTAAERVLRGGSWYYSARHCRAASRIAYLPSFQWLNLGFRLARGPALSKQRGAQARQLRGRSGSGPAERASDHDEPRVAGGPERQEER